MKKYLFLLVLLLPHFALADTACFSFAGSQSAGDSFQFTTQKYVAQPFQVSVSCVPTVLQIGVKTQGSPAGNNLIFYVYTDSSGHPGTQIVNTSAASVAVDGAYHVISASVASTTTLAPSTTYWLVAGSSGSLSGTDYYLAGLSSGASGIGQEASSNAAGSSWTPGGSWQFYQYEIDQATPVPPVVVDTGSTTLDIHALLLYETAMAVATFFYLIMRVVSVLLGGVRKRRRYEM